jgi:hypothetical protein
MKHSISIVIVALACMCGVSLASRPPSWSDTVSFVVTGPGGPATVSLDWNAGDGQYEALQYGVNFFFNDSSDAGDGSSWALSPDGSTDFGLGGDSYVFTGNFNWDGSSLSGAGLDVFDVSSAEGVTGSFSVGVGSGVPVPEANGLAALVPAVALGLKRPDRQRR